MTGNLAKVAGLTQDELNSLSNARAALFQEAWVWEALLLVVWLAGI